jgi:4-hydroxy-3-methylbut-2-en-1-yl diphosphate synthase IspG/GcpE
MKMKPVNKLRCNEAAKYICENLDEQLNSRKCQAIKKHLQSCPNCTKNLTDLKKVIALYRKESTPRLQHTIQKKIFTAIQH